MSAPEIEQKMVPEIEYRPNQVEIPEHIERDMGVYVRPVNPPPIQNGQVMPNVIPQTVPSVPSTNIPANSQDDLVTMSKGDDHAASTWFGHEWLYRIKKAIVKGMRVVFAGGQ